MNKIEIIILLSSDTIMGFAINALLKDHEIDEVIVDIL
jgi:hypothetical protein